MDGIVKDVKKIRLDRVSSPLDFLFKDNLKDQDKIPTGPTYCSIYKRVGEKWSKSELRKPIDYREFFKMRINICTEDRRVLEIVMPISRTGPEISWISSQTEKVMNILEMHRNEVIVTQSGKVSRKRSYWGSGSQRKYFKGY